MKWIWRKIMAFGDIFKDDNDINEKNLNYNKSGK